MNINALVDEIKKKIQDSSYTDTEIIARINEAVLAIATGVLLPDRREKSPPLPDLYATADITTTLASGVTDLPSTFNRDVIQVQNSNNDKIPINSSPRQFLNLNYNEDAGAVDKCSVLGSRLLYSGIPSTVETLTIHFYEKPGVLALDSDEPTEIPLHLHRNLIVGYVCKDIFDEIEDGIEDPKTNTRHYEAVFQSGLLGLEIELGTDGETDYYDDQTEYCA